MSILEDRNKNSSRVAWNRSTTDFVRYNRSKRHALTFDVLDETDSKRIPSRCSEPLLERLLHYLSKRSSLLRYRTMATSMKRYAGANTCTRGSPRTWWTRVTFTMITVDRRASLCTRFFTRMGICINLGDVGTSETLHNRNYPIFSTFSMRFYSISCSNNALHSKIVSHSLKPAKMNTDHFHIPADPT